MSLRLTPLFSVLFLLVANDAAARLTLEQKRRLARGEVLTHSWKDTKADVGKGWAMGVVDATPEQVFQVVADVTRYRLFMKRMTSSKIVRKASGSYDFYYTIDMPWPISDLWCETRNTHEIDRKRRRYRRRWKLLKGTFIHNQGYWLVTPFGKNKALLSYSVVLRPQISLPNFVLDYATKVALPRSVKGMRARVLELKARSQLKDGPLYTP
jgi:ribosome-associated toxin RatA of RatAB toxin-antitoxin module